MAVSRGTLYLLDTNMFNYIANGRSTQARHTFHQLIGDDTIAISAVVEGELLYGIARTPESKRLRASVEALIAMIGILPWDSAAAHAYGVARAQLSAVGKPLSTLDTLIAAHSVAAGAILVTHDKAFKQVPGIRLADWAVDLN